LVYSTFFSQVDLKYITDAQIIEFAYEGKRRRFAIDSIAAKISSNATDNASQLPRSFSVLSIDSPPQLWSVTWDCVISIAANDIPNKDADSQKVRQFNCDCRGASHDTAHVSL
jgi:AAA family ATPase